MKKSPNKVFMIIGVLVATAVAYFYLSAKKTSTTKDDKAQPGATASNTDVKQDKTSGLQQQLEEQAANERMTGCKYVLDTFRKFPTDTTNIEEKFLNDEFYASLRQKGINKQEVTNDKLLGFFKAYDVEPTIEMLDYLGLNRFSLYLKKDKTAGNIPYNHVVKGSMRCLPLGTQAYRLV